MVARSVGGVLVDVAADARKPGGGPMIDVI